MKNIFKTLFFVAITATVMSSCSNKIEGFSDYKEACDNGRFDVAHQFIDRMESYNQYEPLSYVFSKELEIITEEFNRESINDLRNLFYKYEQLGTWSTDRVCEDLIKKAIEKRNIALCEELMSLHTDGDFSGDVKLAILNMYKERDLDKFRNFAISHINDFDVNKYMKEYIMNNNDEVLLRSFISNFSGNILNDEDLVSVFAKYYPVELKNKVRSELLKFKKSVPAMPATGIVQSDSYGEITEEYTSYISEVQEYNARCVEMLICAFNLNDASLANFIISNMSKNLTYQSLGDWCVVVEKRTDGRSSVYNAYNVTLNSDEIEAAKQQVKAYFN